MLLRMTSISKVLAIQIATCTSGGCNALPRACVEYHIFLSAFSRRKQSPACHLYHSCLPKCRTVLAISRNCQVQAIVPVPCLPNPGSPFFPDSRLKDTTKPPCCLSRTCRPLILAISIIGRQHLPALKPTVQQVFFVPASFSNIKVQVISLRAMEYCVVFALYRWQVQQVFYYSGATAMSRCSSLVHKISSLLRCQVVHYLILAIGKCMPPHLLCTHNIMAYRSCYSLNGKEVSVRPISDPHRACPCLE